MGIREMMDEAASVYLMALVEAASDHTEDEIVYLETLRNTLVASSVLLDVAIMDSGKESVTFKITKDDRGYIIVGDDRQLGEYMENAEEAVAVATWLNNLNWVARAHVYMTSGHVDDEGKSRDS